MTYLHIYERVFPEGGADVGSGGIGGFFDEVFTGANVAPCPQVGSSPPSMQAPKTWQAPDVSGAGQVTVHRDHLTSAADVIKSYLPELDAAIKAVQAQEGAFASLSGWRTAEQALENLVATVQGFAAVGGGTSDAHATTAAKLVASAGAYDQAESSSTHAANGIGGGGPGPAGGGSSSGSGSSSKGWL